MSGKTIAAKLNAVKEVSYIRRYHCHYEEFEVMLGKRSVKQFFCKRRSMEMLFTTDVSIGYLRAYEIFPCVGALKSSFWTVNTYFV